MKAQNSLLLGVEHGCPPLRQHLWIGGIDDYFVEAVARDGGSREHAQFAAVGVRP
ncbi:MAG: hypothetical protein WBD41_00215 [Rhodococcus sp. (in: high G+C Gram-positive bacteria)]|jgi:hypothetical protein|uniref:hypothetical protein n=1 Tax=Rhodococcus sp. EPR-157 TaxID=1813677 RepID=UPI0012E8C429|nr:hypothetical protein [Rhodococcus sp. EPR-157]